jgi:hypothetical protein
VTIPVSINRSATHFERVTLTSAAPADVSTGIDRTSAYGFEGTGATLTVTVPATIAGGAYTVTVTGTQHGRTSQASIPISIIGRLAGPDRFSTAAAVSVATFGPGVPVAYIANAFNFPDALAGAAAAGTAVGPVLLAAASGPLHPATAAELARLKPARIVVLGSAGVVSDAVAAQLAAYVTAP